jgi:hypothetical protein
MRRRGGEERKRGREEERKRGREEERRGSEEWKIGESISGASGREKNGRGGVRFLNNFKNIECHIERQGRREQPLHPVTSCSVT